MVQRGPRTRVLVVEDEKKVADALREGLEGEGYEVAVEYTGGGAVARLEAGSFDAIVLDLMLPGRSGYEILALLRGRGDHTRVLVLTARDTVDDRVKGLNVGADDYLVKPFAFAELLARLRAVLRRGRTTDALQLEVGDLRVDVARRKVTRGGRAVDLTAREFDVLHYLLRNAGQIVSREALARDVWTETARSTTLDNVMDVHIARLRRKIDLDEAVRLIHTVRGVGFIVSEEEP
jgi:DNA-binding response OmpR family regulator